MCSAGASGAAGTAVSGAGAGEASGAACCSTGAGAGAGASCFLQATRVERPKRATITANPNLFIFYILLFFGTAVLYANHEAKYANGFSNPPERFNPPPFQGAYSRDRTSVGSCFPFKHPCLKHFRDEKKEAPIENHGKLRDIIFLARFTPPVELREYARYAFSFKNSRSHPYCQTPGSKGSARDPGERAFSSCQEFKSARHAAELTHNRTLIRRRAVTGQPSGSQAVLLTVKEEITSTI